MGNTDNPVFIGGCGRSGTTMLGALLGAHEECLCIPESQFKTDLLKEINHKTLKEIVESVNQHPRFKLWNIDLEINNNQFFTSYNEVLESFIESYGKKMNKPNYKIWVDHTPNNIEYIKQLLILYPKAKFVHIVRDGRGVASSIMPLDWGPNVISHSATLWKSKLSYGLAAEHYLETKQIIRIRYEDLVSNTELTLNKVCAFLGIEFKESMLKGGGFSPPKYTTHQHQFVGKEPNISRINAWEKKLDPRQIEQFEYLTGDLLECLGYESKYGVKSKKISKTEKIRLNLKEFIFYIINSFRIRIRKFINSKF